MLLRSLKVENKGKTIIDTELWRLDNEQELNTTLVLGENGVGKSFFLKIVTDIFIYLEKTLNQNRKPKYEYESFQISYVLNGDLYEINRISSREIQAKKNGEVIDYKSIGLPSKLLAVSFMVNDKFVFSKNEEGTYKYLGVRSSTNSTYTSSVTRKLTENLITTICAGKYSEVIKILRMIKFDARLEFDYENKSKGIKKTYLAENAEDMKELSSYLGHIYGISVFFWKNGKRVTFDNCSSGEKHVLFAFVGILCQIESESLILIDEPEISLHPEWQIQYISKLKEIFGTYSKCHFVLASHSHYFVSDLPQNASSIVIFRHGEGSSPQAELLPFDTNAWSAENIIYNVFGLRTTRNYYFEADISKLIKTMSNYKGDENQKNDIAELITKLKRYSLGANDPLNALINDAEGVIACSVSD